MAIARHHDDGHGQLSIANLANQVQSADSWQAKVGQHQRAWVLHQPFHGGRAVGRDRDLPVGMGQKLRKLLADQLAVVHHEDASIHGALIRVEVGGLIPDCSAESRQPPSTKSDWSTVAAIALLFELLHYDHFLVCQAVWANGRQMGRAKGLWQEVLGEIFPAKSDRRFTRSRRETQIRFAAWRELKLKIRKRLAAIKSVSGDGSRVSGDHRVGFPSRVRAVWPWQRPGQRPPLA